MKLIFYKNGKKVKVHKNVDGIKTFYEWYGGARYEYIQTERIVDCIQIYDRVEIIPDKRKR